MGAGKVLVRLHVCAGLSEPSLLVHAISTKTWVKVFRIIPEFSIFRMTFHRESFSKC